MSGGGDPAWGYRLDRDQLSILKRAGDRYRVVAVCANRTLQRLPLAREFDAEFAAVEDPDGFAELRRCLEQG
jgi:1-deoxy-D-xylulose 5-phosphate reductoisomerase